MTSTIPALPGMGADAHMYAAQPWRELPVDVICNLKFEIPPSSSPAATSSP